MEEGGGGESAKGSSSFMSAGGRQRFEVELRPGETTIVSWKKLVKDANKVKAPAPAPEHPSIPHHAHEPPIAPGQPAENEANDAPPASRFSAVVEKIERLYMGKNSSDEEDLNDVPDDDEYDTEDSFIDDTELDEYFQVDNSAIKHDGFFVNRGKLERTNEPTASPNQQPKKRRKDLAKDHGGTDDGHVPNKLMKVNKAAGRSVPLVGMKSTSPSHSIATPMVQLEDMRIQNQINPSEIGATRKSADNKAPVDPSLSRISNGEAVTVVKDIDNQKAGVPQSKNHGNKLKDGSEFSSASSQRSNDKSSYAKSKSQSGRLPHNAEELNQLVQQREKNSIRERSDVKVPENSQQTVKNPLLQRKEGSNVKPKITMLEKAIRELEKIVAESRPPSMEVPDADISSQAVKRRMPPEIKQKLAKVARLAQAGHGKISKELLNRLMSILGHLIQLRTLKRNLKVMVNMGLSAKQEKDARFQLIKKEVDEMVKIRVPLMKSKAIEQQAGTSDDFQEIGTKEKVLKRRFSMDDTLEDTICELYDLFVDGIEEDAGPQVRKLYAELAELWPKGFMDNHGIKRAICRAKDRKKALHNRHKDQEKLKRKKLLTPPKTQETIRVEASSIPQPQYVQEKSVNDSTNNGLTSVNRPIPNTTVANAAARMVVTSVNGPNMDRPKQEKVKGSSGNLSDVRTTEVLVNKKVKRKPQSELGEGNIRPEKLNSAQGEERHKSNKQVTSSLQKTTLQSPAAAAHPPATLNSSVDLI